MRCILSWLDLEYQQGLYCAWVLPLLPLPAIVMDRWPIEIADDDFCPCSSNDAKVRGKSVDHVPKAILQKLRILSRRQDLHYDFYYRESARHRVVRNICISEIHRCDQSLSETVETVREHITWSISHRLFFCTFYSRFPHCALLWGRKTKPNLWV